MQLVTVGGVEEKHAPDYGKNGSMDTRSHDGCEGGHGKEALSRITGEGKDRELQMFWTFSKLLLSLIAGGENRLRSSRCSG